MLEIHLLGKFALIADGRPLDLPLRAAQSLIAYLVLSPGTPHRREQLAGLLWPDADESTAKGNLRHTLWRLRKVLGPQGAIVADDLTLTFNPTADFWLDAQVVGQKLPTGASIQDLVAAVSAYGGELLPGFYDNWVVLERERLQAALEHKMDALLDGLLAAQRWEDVLEWGERWIALGHTPEAAYRALIMAHSGRGDAAAAAAAYQRCIRALQTDLGVEPSAQTRAAAQTAGRTFQAAAPRNNLPNPLSSFIGREKEVAQVKQLLTEHRLVMLTGSGGIGKTRLLLQVASELQGNYPHGIWLVELAPLADPALVPQAIATALAVTLRQDVPIPVALANYLRTKTLLLVLDNCEHLLEACARLAEMLLRNCPDLRILSSSREALGVEGESVYRVPSLSLPDPQGRLQSIGEAEAVQLFVARAAAALPGFALSQTNAPHIAQVCRRLDGVALAIELAAARVKLLKVEQISARLDDAFGLLIGGGRTALPHQQTLRATMEWSYNLLTADERTLLQRLSVFSGGWTLEAAEGVCADPGESLCVLDLLSQLVDKSLVVVEREQGQDSRYRLLETIRLYAQAKLSQGEEEPALRARHLHYFADWMAKTAQYLLGPEQKEWLVRCEAEANNLRVALEWGLHADWTTGLRLAAAAHEYWRSASQLSETAQSWWRAYLNQCDAAFPSAVRAEMLAYLAESVMYLDDTQAQHYAEQSLAAVPAGSEPSALAHLVLAFKTIGSGDDTALLEHLNWAERLARKAGDQLALGTVYNYRGQRAWGQGKAEESMQYRQETLRIYLEMGHLRLVAYAKLRLGIGLAVMGDLRTARRLAEEGVTSLCELGLRQHQNNVILGDIALWQGDYAVSEVEYLNWLAEDQSSVNPTNHARCLWILAYTAFVQGQDARMWVFLNALRQVFEKATISSEARQEVYARLGASLAQIYCWLGDEVQSRYWLKQEAAVSLDPFGKAGYVSAGAELDLRQGHLAQAADRLRQSLQFHFQAQQRVYVVWVMELQAEILCRLGQTDPAARLFGATAAYRTCVGMPQHPRFKPHFDAILACLCEQLGEDAFARAYAEGQAQTLDEAAEQMLTWRWPAPAAQS